MKSRKPKSIIRTILSVTITASLILIFASVGIMTFSSLLSYKKNKTYYYDQYLNERKTFIRHEVDKVVFMVENLIRYRKDSAINKNESLEDFQNMIINKIANLRFGNNGYFFGSAEKGEPLFSEGFVTKGTSNIWDLTDPEGVKIIQEQLKALDEEKGVFVNYSWKKLDSKDPVAKISYSKAIKEWNWTIGAGVYLDDILTVVAANEDLLKRNLKRQFMLIGLVFMLYAIASYLFFKGMSINIKESLYELVIFFESAINDKYKIDHEKLRFSEFKKIANVAELMLRKLDITETALRQNQLKYKLLAEIQKDVIIASDPDGKLVYCSPTITKFAGYDPEKETGKPIRDFLADEKQVTLLNNVSKKIFESKLPQMVELLFKAKNGQIIPVEVSITPIIEAGEIIEFNSIIRNISKRKEMEKELDNYRKNLEKIVEERTEELRVKNEDLRNFNQQLEKMNSAFVGREFRIKELREQIKDLKEKI